MGELPLFGVALGAGAVAMLLARLVPLFRSLGAWPSGGIVALFAFLIAQGADPFAGKRSWRYAPPGCDFAVEFPRPPEILAGESRLADRQTKPVTRALLTDIGVQTSWSAECLDFGHTLAAADKDAVLAAAEAQLKASAARLRIKVERVERLKNDTIALAGFSDEGRTATNELLLRRAEARGVLGKSSLLVLWAWKTEREGERAPFGDAFFGSVSQR